MAIQEVIFRGKRKDNGEWVEGYYSNLGGNRPCILKEHILNGKMARILEYENIIVLPSTVGQYTSLDDKNGVRIFEGDIVRYGDTIHEVVFEKRNTTAYFGLVYSEIETMPFGHYQDLNHIEVIGNINDSPELLEGDTK